MNVAPSTPRSLLDLTSDELDIIMGYVGYKEIQVLRKVCSPLRDYIDRSQLDSELLRVKVEEFRSGTIQLWLISEGNTFIIDYQKHPEGCFIEFEKYTEAGQLVNRTKLLKDVDYATTAGNDLGLILKHHQSTLDSFDFESKSIPQKRLTVEFSRIFLAGKKFHIWGAKEELLMKFLPYLEPITLYSISIYSPSNVYLRLKKVLELDQWKTAKKFQAHYLTYNSPLATLAHFKSVCIWKYRLTTKNVMELKEILLRQIREYSYRSRFLIFYNLFSDKRKLMNWLQITRMDQEAVHTIRTDSNRSLQIKWRPSGESIEFSVVVDPNM
uniref:F-box domain-containing protein n=1 Tax=Caenorhabditis tropicalis TaxID=1561998 RepID=A0A1I7TI97_9PELO